MIDSLLVRCERPPEFKVIYNLVKTAFETARVKDGTEQDFVDRLRERDGYFSELALVAEKNRTIIGHIMLTKVELTADDGRPTRALLLAPLSVALEWRGQGVGAELVREALRRAKGAGFESVFLAGDPGYYGRFGFVRSDSFGVTSDSGIPPQFLLALELVPGVLTPGKVVMVSE